MATLFSDRKGPLLINFCLKETSSMLLFSRLKESLAGKTFSDDDEDQDTVMTWLREQAGDFYDAGIKNSFPGSLSAL
jgi:hypothetical protein